MTLTSTVGFSIVFWGLVTSSNQNQHWVVMGNGGNEFFVSPCDNNEYLNVRALNNVYSTTYATPMGAWMHIAVTIDASSNLVVFVNGSSVYTTVMQNGLPMGSGLRTFFGYWVRIGAITRKGDAGACCRLRLALTGLSRRTGAKSASPEE